MFGTIKRVISNPDELDQKEGKISKTEAMAATMNESVLVDSEVPNTQEELNARSPPTIVELDDRLENDSDGAVEVDDSAASTASSVSDHTGGGGKLSDSDGDVAGDTLPTDLIRREKPLIRPNSQVSAGGSSISSARTGGAASSRDASGNWGWFEDVHTADAASAGAAKDGEDSKKSTTKTKKEGLLHLMEPLNDAAAVGAPNYVLEESRSSQKLWKNTAGNRPPQPMEERAFYEKMWAQNFERSQVKYEMPLEVLIASSPISLSAFADGTFDETADNRRSELSNYNLPAGQDGGSTGAGAHLAAATLIHRMHDPSRTVNTTKETGGKIKTADGELTVLIRGDNVFGTTVSKSFARSDETGAINGVDTVNISIASYRVVESKKDGKYAQFLVIYREGSIRDTLGVWKRFSDFLDLSRLVTASHEGCSSVLANMSPLAVTEEHEVEHLPNAITSWKLLKKRQRWYRCLDAGYLSLKVFLLERFLHDILFESSSPKLLRDFALGTSSEATESAEQ